MVAGCNYLGEFFYGCIAGVAVGEFVDIGHEVFFPIFHSEEYVSGGLVSVCIDLWRALYIPWLEWEKEIRHSGVPFILFDAVK